MTNNTPSTLTVGQKFETYYSNGQHHGSLEIKKLTDSSVFFTKTDLEGYVFGGVTPFRESRTTFNKCITKGYYRPVSK